LPPQDQLLFVHSQHAQHALQEVRVGAGMQATPPFASLFLPSTNPQALDLLSRMLQFSPDHRISVQDALAHPYLQDFHTQLASPDHGVPFDDLDKRESGAGGGGMTDAEVRRCMFEEVCKYRPYTCKEGKGRSTKGSLKGGAEGGDKGGGGDGGGGAMDVSDDAHATCAHGGC
ncbi:hypothetical protein B484DRAFT_409144, partial [Ochromonadaceae sp. CCMP2298]